MPGGRVGRAPRQCASQARELSPAPLRLTFRTRSSVGFATPAPAGGVGSPAWVGWVDRGIAAGIHGSASWVREPGARAPSRARVPTSFRRLAVLSADAGGVAPSLALRLPLAAWVSEEGGGGGVGWDVRRSGSLLGHPRSVPLGSRLRGRHARHGARDATRDGSLQGWRGVQSALCRSPGTAGDAAARASAVCARDTVCMPKHGRTWSGTPPEVTGANVSSSIARDQAVGGVAAWAPAGRMIWIDPVLGSCPMGLWGVYTRRREYIVDGPGIAVYWMSRADW